jgi:cytochrome c peroxidase
MGLFNSGDPKNEFMFWDGRVHYSTVKKVFTTPERAFNGENPAAVEITSVMQSALSAQSLFPIVNSDEMKGRPGDNEIANAKTDLAAWELIVKRLTGVSGLKYNDLFKRAYPDVQKVNIGHVGEAMGTFMREAFQSNGSPFNRYAAGDASALNAQQKRGLRVFMTSNCIACHSGPTLGNNAFFTSVGVPFYGAKPFVQDRGRAEVTNEKLRTYFFKTPSLINVKLTAPYMHNGAFKTLRDVINHYSDINISITSFDISKRRAEFPVEVEVLNSPDDTSALWDSIQARFLKVGLNLTSENKDDLEAFLKDGLTDPKWDPKNSNFISPF